MSRECDLTDEEKADLIAEEAEYQADQAKEQEEWYTIHPELRPKPVVQPIIIDRMKVITFRFRESGYNDLRCIAQVKGSQLFGSKNALDLSMIIRMALEEFIAREK